ncbi:MAG: type II secretion system major pseudopilin GspG [Puniceicoccaceae bacterium]
MSHSKSRSKPRRSGFSLVEMLIVIALIAVIGTLAIPKIVDYFSGAQASVAEEFVKSGLKLPLTKYRIDTGSFPSTEDGGLMALLNQPSGMEGKWKGPYIDELPDDPWGTPYQYKYPGTHNKSGYDFWSFGPDKSPSPEDNIGNW